MNVTIRIKGNKSQTEQKLRGFLETDLSNLVRQKNKNTAQLFEVEWGYRKSGHQQTSDKRKKTTDKIIFLYTLQNKDKSLFFHILKVTNFIGNLKGTPV